MLRIRILAAAAPAAIMATLAINAAAAQTSSLAARPAPLAGLDPPHATNSPHAPKMAGTQAVVHAKTASHVKTAHKTAAHTVHLAGKPAAQRPAVLAAKESADAPPPSAVPQDRWPMPEEPAAASVAATEPAADPAPPKAEPDRTAMIVNGQTVQIAAPADVNELDLAADEQQAAAASLLARDDSAEEEPAPARTPLVATAMRTEQSIAGNASWIAQVLAALGGVLAAASVAWFLIGFGPARRYG